MKLRQVFSLRGSITLPAVLCALVFAHLFLGLGPARARAQDGTVFVDDFQSFNVGTLSTGCGDMTAAAWRWGSHHHFACYSAGWGVDYGAPMGGNTTTSDKNLILWGGVPFGGGGDCAATAVGPELQGLSDYVLTVTVTPLALMDGMSACKRGMVGVAGRVGEAGAFCSGYLLALVLDNGESLCGQGSLLQLLRNERGPDCDGSKALTLMASEPVNITADLGGMFDPEQEYVLKLSMAGSEIHGGVWAAEDWNGGDGPSLAEVAATDETYAAGTFGLYQGSARAGFDNVLVTLGESSEPEEPEGLAADLDFDPNTLNTKSKGKYVTCYVELAEGDDPWDIDLATVLLNDVVPAEMSPTDVGDHDMDGVDDRMIKFKRADVISLLSVADDASHSGSGVPGGAEWLLGGGAGGAEWSAEGVAEFAGSQAAAKVMSHADSVEVWVSGLLTDGTAFSAKDTIRVMSAGKGNGGEGDSGDSDGAGEGLDSDSEGLPALSVTPTFVKGTTRIGFELAVAGHVRLLVYDAAGRMVKTLMDGHSDSGVHYTTWDRTSDNGRNVLPGVYFVRVSQAGRSSGQKLMVVE